MIDLPVWAIGPFVEVSAGTDQFIGDRLAKSAELFYIDSAFAQQQPTSVKVNEAGMKNEVVIVSAVRTPLASFQGALSSLSAAQLGAHAITEAVERAGLNGEDIEEVYLGNVVSAGIGQAPARQAALQGGVPDSVPCTTVSKVCGSGMKAVMLAADTIRLGDRSCVLAGGMESMSNAPYLLDKARAGYRLGHHSARDSLFVDGLEDAKSGRLMGEFGQQTADDFNVSRERMDDFAIKSLNRARVATDSGHFEDEICPVIITNRQGTHKIIEDEQVRSAKPEKIPTLKPAFKRDGSVTAANSSSISDGAAALVIMDRATAKKRKLSPLAKIVGYSSHARAPEEFTLAPIGAIKKLLDQVSWGVDDVDLFEINEAFAVVTIVAMSELGIDHKKVNIHGGACALGHPLGASGARIIVTLIHALRQTGKTRGVASLCIGGGEATALAIELA